MPSLSPVLLLQATPAEVAQMLRGDALNLGLGILLLGVGVAATLVYLRAFRRKAASLPWFGLFTFLYGLRLLIKTGTLSLLFSAPPAFWRYASASITYAIFVPGVLFVRAMFPRWRRPLGLAAVGLVAFAVCAVVADVLLQRPFSAQTPNNLIAIALIGVALALGFRPGLPPSRDLRTLRIGLASMAAAALVDNLRGLGVISWPRSEVEPFGATVFIASLGTLTVRRTLEGAKRLLALDKELAIARRIQSSILPRSMPSIPGLAVSARYEPMTEVAGDFYEFLEMGARGLGILVADVSGHGVPAALIASMVKVAIAAQKPQGDHPAAVLAGMNETLGGQLGGQYVTAAYLFVDREAGLMRYGAAGHPPLLRFRPDDGRALELEENGLPLGMMDVAEYRQLEQPLRPGDRFLLYTDGLADATNPAGDFFGIERVKAEMAATAGLSVEKAADSILEKTRGWTAEVADDDVTFVLVDCA
jgi:sigma-B regulation protein RsbU (phosphoserine phosphatase)